MSTTPQTDASSNKNLAPPRPGGQAPDPSRKRSFEDVMSTLPDTILKILQEVKSSTRPTELAVVGSWFKASGVDREPTEAELSAEWNRRVDSGAKNNPPAPAAGAKGAKGRAEALKRFGSTK